MRAITSAAALALALAAAGCGDGTGPFASTTAPPTSSAVTTTVTTTAPTTTAAPSTFAVGTPRLYPPDPLPGSGGANGSGCPPQADYLPDGIWFGKLGVVAPQRAEFDPGCFYFGEAAVAAAAEDGITDLPSPHYLRNPMPDQIEVPVAAGALAYSIDNSGNDLGFLTFSLEEWPARSGGYTLCPGEGCSVWLFVNGGMVTEILEQYLP